MITKNATLQEIEAELQKPAGTFLWDHHEGYPSSLQGKACVQRVPVPFKFAMSLLATVGRDCPLNKHVYLFEPFDEDGGEFLAVGVGVYDNRGWIYSLTL